MRKILLPVVALVALAAVVGSTLQGCTGETKQADTLDTTVINPMVTALPDSTGDEVKSVTGKVMDGAMNSVWIEVAPDSTIEFSYPELDRNNSEVFYNWSIDDEITVEYIEKPNNSDSVVSIQKAH